MSERMLITKLVRKGDRAELYAKGHKYKDLTLFTISDLVDVGIEYEALQEGVETPCRFWAHYELSDKLNQHGNPYKDILMLEPVDKPATTTSTDNSALLAEMRTMVAELCAIRAVLEMLATKFGAEVPEVALGDSDKLADWLGDSETRAQEQAIHDELEAMNQARQNGKTQVGVPMDSKELVAWLNVRNDNPKTCDGVGHLAYVMKKHFDDDWGWPNGTDQAGWNDVAKAWYDYWKALA